MEQSEGFVSKQSLEPKGFMRRHKSLCIIDMSPTKSRTHKQFLNNSQKWKVATGYWINSIKYCKSNLALSWLLSIHKLLKFLISLAKSLNSSSSVQWNQLKLFSNTCRASFFKMVQACGISTYVKCKFSTLQKSSPFCLLITTNGDLFWAFGVSHGMSGIEVHIYMQYQHKQLILVTLSIQRYTIIRQIVGCLQGSSTQNVTE